MSERVELLVAEIRLLEAQTRILQARVRELETAGEARLHALEVGLARLSHGPEEHVPIRTRGYIDDRGIVVLLRNSAA